MTITIPVTKEQLKELRAGRDPNVGIAIEDLRFECNGVYVKRKLKAVAVQPVDGVRVLLVTVRGRE